MTAELIARMLGGRKSINGQWICKCPGHDDKTESFTVSDGKTGAVLMHCFAGCHQRDLFMKVKARFESMHGPATTTTPKITRTIDYTYQDESGRDVFKSRRVEFDNGTKSFKMLHAAGKDWVYGKGQVRFPPYRFAHWKNSPIVFLVEGEKCVEAAESLGAMATCIPGGAKAWTADWAKWFDGKEVFIVPDNDEPGKQFARAAYADLSNITQCAILELPELGPKEDIVEWIERGGTKEKLFDLAAALRQHPVVAMGFEDEFRDTRFVEEIQLKNSQAVIPFGIPFLDDVWRGILPSDLVVFTAKSGMGKTQTAMNISKEVILSGGRVAFFALEAFKKEIGARMIYTVAVDNYLKRKLPADPWASFGDWISGDFGLVSAMERHTNEARKFVSEKWAGRFFTYYIKDRFTIEDFEKRYPIISREVDLVVFDHLHYLSKSTGSLSHNDFLSDAIYRIKDLVNQYEKPVLMVVHVRKEDTTDRKPVPDAEDIHGSSDIFKNATKIICMGRPLAGGYDGTTNTQTSYFKIAKDRFGNASDWMIAKMKFDRAQQIYLPGYDLVRVQKNASKVWEETPIQRSFYPHWYGRSSIRDPQLSQYLPPI